MDSLLHGWTMETQQSSGMNRIQPIPIEDMAMTMTTTTKRKRTFVCTSVSNLNVFLLVLCFLLVRSLPSFLLSFHPSFLVPGKEYHVKVIHNQNDMKKTTTATTADAASSLSSSSSPSSMTTIDKLKRAVKLPFPANVQAFQLALSTK